MMRGEDCRPLTPQPTSDQVQWLREVAALAADDLVVSLTSDPRHDDEPIVYCAWDGTWWAGRYVGTIHHAGQRLTIAPRFGLSTLRRWISLATSVILTDTPGRLEDDDSFIIELIAAVWARGLVKAARHGLPSLRSAHVHRGNTIRGRLDVPATVRMRTSLHTGASSIEMRKTLAHDATCAIVAAHSMLEQALRGRPWEPARVRELMPAMRAAVGYRPRIPTHHDLRRIRYTPITAGFAPVAELSLNLVKHRGLLADADADGHTTGVLLDVAELWEIYVGHIARLALPIATITHGSRADPTNRRLLTSAATGDELGTLIPDYLITDGATTGVIDAKYKSLHPTRQAPNGPQAADLYQMAAYLQRFTSAESGWGILAYPDDPLRPETPIAEAKSPWHTPDDRALTFARLPHENDEAVARLVAAIGPSQPAHSVAGVTHR